MAEEGWSMREAGWSHWLEERQQMPDSELLEAREEKAGLLALY